MTHRTFGLLLASVVLLVPGLRAQSTEQQIIADAAAALGGRERILAVRNARRPGRWPRPECRSVSPL
jgi:hypothetical protein